MKELFFPSVITTTAAPHLRNNNTEFGRASYPFLAKCTSAKLTNLSSFMYRISKYDNTGINTRSDQVDAVHMDPKGL